MKNFIVAAALILFSQIGFAGESSKDQITLDCTVNSSGAFGSSTNHCTASLSLDSILGAAAVSPDGRVMKSICGSSEYSLIFSVQSSDFSSSLHVALGKIKNKKKKQSVSIIDQGDLMVFAHAYSSISVSRSTNVNGRVNGVSCTVETGQDFDPKR